MHKAYESKVYVRRAAEGPWHHEPGLRCLECRTHAGPAVGAAELVRYYGGPSGPLDLLNAWVRVAADTPEGERGLFVGLVVRQRREEAESAQYWTAHEPKELLARIQIVTLWGEDGRGPLARPVRPVVFNGRSASGGRRSLSRYHFARPHRGEPCQGGDETDAAWALGTGDPWDAWTILEHLLRGYCPRTDSGPGGFCPIGFDLAAPDSVRAQLEANRGEYNLFGATLLDAVDRLVRDSGDLSWWVDTAEDGVHGPGFPVVRIFSREHAERAEPAADVAADDVLPVTIEDDDVNRVTEVWAFGGPCRFMFTLRSDGAPAYGKGWSEALEAAWREARPEALRDMLDRFAPVYREFAVADDESWDDVFLGPDLERFESEPGDMKATGEAWRMEWYPHARPFLPCNLTCSDALYENQQDEARTALRQTAPGGSASGRVQPLMAWLAPDSATESVRPLRVEPLDDRSGFRILDHPSDLQLDQQDRWRRLLVTGTVEGDWLLLAKAAVPLRPGESPRIRFVFEPAYEWWAACPGTIVHLDAGATWSGLRQSPPAGCRTVYGVLRNDWPRLKALAESMLRKFNTVRRAVRLRFKTVSADWRPGRFVGEYEGCAVQAPVMTVAHVFADDERYGTTIQTLFSME